MDPVSCEQGRALVDPTYWIGASVLARHDGQSERQRKMGAQMREKSQARQPDCLASAMSCNVTFLFFFSSRHRGCFNHKLRQMPVIVLLTERYQTCQRPLCCSRNQ